MPNSALLILNGKKSDYPGLRERVQALRSRGYSLGVRVTWEEGDAARYVQEAADLGFDQVIACGGDGTLNEVANGFMKLERENRPALGIAPLGTANDFAVSCCYPEDPLDALDSAMEAKPKAIDLVRANDHYLVNVASLGFGAVVTQETPVELKNFLGGGAYTLMAILKALNFQPFPIRLKTPRTEFEGEAIVGAVCNGRQSGGGQVLAKNAFLDDGVLDTVLILPFPIARIDQVIDEISEPGDGGDFVRYYQEPWVELSASDEIPVNLDGEPHRFQEVRFEVVESSIDLLLPEGCPCVGGE